ncbi:MAG: DNA mismatch repair protein MutS, partial [Candidatus Atribacteria bacterium]|nr:DNA mismatch repair protein MutS [Candidatus Atribacteria bacterium]
MKAYLMFRDRDLNPNPEFSFHKEILIQDLALHTLFNAMAIDQADLFDVVSKVVLSSLTQVDEILYRQSILKDCLKNPTIIRDMYNIAVETIETRRKHHLGSVLFNYPSTILYGSVKLMQFFVEMLKKLKNIADQHAEKFESEGFTTFFEMIKRELDDDYFALIQYHLKELQFRDGVLISAELTDGNVGTQYILRKPNDKKGNWVKRVFSKRSPFFSFSIHPRDEGGARALSELRDRGINLVANALAQSAEHILSFFNMLKLELSFYVGCLNLYDQL